DIPLRKLRKRRKLSATSSYDSEEDIPLRILKERRKSKNTSSYTATTSADDVTVNKYKIETLTEYQQLSELFEQQMKTYNKIKRSLNLYVTKADEIRTEINNSD